jgi:Type I restriction modification DNA specificity domain
MNSKLANLFMEQFSLLVSGPDGVQKVRDLVLRLALGGHFSGSVESFESWKAFNIEELADISVGNSISAAEKSEKFEGRREGLSYIATKDVEGWNGRIVYETGVKIPENEARFRVARDGSVLICAEGGSAGRKIGLVEQDVCFGNKLICCNPRNELVLQRYLFRVFQSPDFYQTFKGEMTGIIGGISLASFRRIPLLVPSLDCQEYLIARINEMMMLCHELEAGQMQELASKRKSVTSTLHHLAQSRTADDTARNWSILSDEFSSLFNDPETIRELRSAILEMVYSGKLQPTANWPMNCLADVVAFGPKNGYSPKPAGGATATKSITLSAITSGRFDPSQFKYIDEHIDAGSHLWLSRDDILIQRGNSLSM